MAIFSRVDRWISRAGGHRFFSGGFGATGLLDQLAARPHGFGLPELGEVTLRRMANAPLGHLHAGAVESPAAVGPLPAEARTLHFTQWLPAGATPGRPSMAILADVVPTMGALPSRLLAQALVQQGVGVVQLEAPWHGRRAPAGHASGAPDTVSDFLLMQRAVALELSALAAWLLAQGHPKVALTGFGLGGSLAAYAGALFPLPLAVAPLLAPDAAAAPFLDGAWAQHVDWPVLQGGGDLASARERLQRALEAISVVALPRAPTPPAILLAARADGIIPPASTLRLARRLAGAPIRFVPGGHASVTLRHLPKAVRLIGEALDRVEALGPLDP